MPEELKNIGIGSIPMPDPTLRTLEYQQSAIIGLKEIVFTRLDAIDKATSLFETNLVRVPTDTQRAVSTLQSLHEARFDQVGDNLHSLDRLCAERFLAVDKQFEILDKAIKEKATRDDQALQAALSAAKEAVSEQNKSFYLSSDKSERAFTKLLDQQAEAVTTLGNNLSEKVNDLKGNQSLGEGRSAGLGSAWAWAIAAIGALVGVGGFVVAVIILFLRTSGK